MTAPAPASAHATQKAPIDLSRILNEMNGRRASDAFVSVGAPVVIKVEGTLESISPPITEDQARTLVLSAMDDRQRASFEQTREANYALGTGNSENRFRVSAFYQKGSPGMVLRRIESRIPSMADLQLPDILAKMVMAKRGIVLFVGATGAGKSTSLAAMVQYRNHHSHGHIITIEDPIEYVHAHQGCVIDQREVGVDTDNWETALKNTLRQAPDVILIGEVRTRETMEYAINFAETGHLVLCTLHANNASQTIERIINFFPEDRHRQLLLDLSLNMQGLIAQQLVPTVDGARRHAVVEVLTMTPRARELIRKGNVTELKGIMDTGNDGMLTFDNELVRLHLEGIISQEEAMRHADSSGEVQQKIRLRRGGTDLDNLPAWSLSRDHDDR